ncbi:hypothetical protein ACFFX1_54040 [Dactylosporangium sucinum]|uniref:Uncharacterized protein n=1 Tax=Dactylosporangium sucinum TaxID=1424081 RepID=A0A917U823_9ACTN|nr:hypothetical protein [Dactylosporangium sucinum]GGM64977.1 hypothetical protein GCM10007977_078050 [Dactylosporangium sucinum]
MARRGHSTSIGKFAKVHHDRRVSEIRMLGELLRRERQAGPPLRERHVVHVDRPTVHHD